VGGLGNEIDIVYGAALCGLAARVVLSNRPVELSPLGIALMAFVAAGLVALVAGILSSGDAATPLNHFRGLFGYAFVPLLIMSLGPNAREQRRALLVLLALVALATAGRGVLSWAQLNGLVQLGGVLGRLAEPDTAVVGAVPALSGDFGYLRAWAGNLEGNTLGVFALMLLPITVGLVLSEAGLLRRAVLVAGAVLLAAVLVVSYSRGAYIGLAVVAAPALYALWRRRPAAAVALAVVGAAALLLLINHLPGAEDRLVTIRSLHDDPTVQHRQAVYEEVLQAIGRNPVWGVGLGTAVGQARTGADSLVLFVPLRGGLLVTTAALALAWAFARRLQDAWRRGALRGLEVAVALGVLGFAVHSLFDYTLWNPKVALTVWLLVGLIAAAAQPDEPALSAGEEPRWQRW
jgi:O-antigen ligase